MKKFISGFVVGALLFGGTAAIAAQPNLVGHKVQSVFNVEKDGKKIAEAVAINGATYAPVRAIAEATGTSFKVEGKTITMSDKASLPIANSSDDAIPVSIQISSKQNQINILNQTIESAKSGKKAWEDLLDPEGYEGPELENADQVRKRIAEADQRIAEAQAEVNKLEAEIAALQ